MKEIMLQIDQQKKIKTEQPLYQAQETRITLAALNNVINYKAFYFFVYRQNINKKHD